MLQLNKWHFIKLCFKIFFVLNFVCVFSIDAKAEMDEKWKSVIQQSDNMPEASLEDRWTEIHSEDLHNELHIEKIQEEYFEKTKIDGWAVSPNGKIAIVLDDLYILEIFDENGKFLTGFDIRFDIPQNIHVKFASDDELYVEYARDNIVVKLNCDGTLLGMWRSDPQETYLSFDYWNPQTTSQYRYYRDEKYRDRIVRTDFFGGEEKIIVQKKTNITWFDKLGLKRFLILFTIVFLTLTGIPVYMLFRQENDKMYSRTELKMKEKSEEISMDNHTGQYEFHSAFGKEFHEYAKDYISRNLFVRLVHGLFLLYLLIFIIFHRPTVTLFVWVFIFFLVVWIFEWILFGHDKKILKKAGNEREGSWHSAVCREVPTGMGDRPDSKYVFDTEDAPHTKLSMDRWERTACIMDVKKGDEVYILDVSNTYHVVYPRHGYQAGFSSAWDMFLKGSLSMQSYNSKQRIIAFLGCLSGLPLELYFLRWDMQKEGSLVTLFIICAVIVVLVKVALHIFRDDRKKSTMMRKV